MGHFDGELIETEHPNLANNKKNQSLFPVMILKQNNT